VLSKELFDSDLGVTIDASSLGSLRELSADELVDDLETFGVVRVRGAAVEVEAFRDLVQRLGVAYQPAMGATKDAGGYELNVNRDKIEIAGKTSATVSTVNVGAHGINLHAEASYGPDFVLLRPSRFGLGFQLTQPERALGPNDRSFGHFGAGGSLGFADPESRLAFGYVMNRSGPRWQNPRNRALIDAIYASL